MFEMYKSIIVVTNRLLCSIPFNKQIERVCSLQPRAVILREKDLGESEYEKLAREISNICARCGVPLILHTYTRAALNLGISRIHLSMDVLRKCDCIRAFETVGASVHSVSEAKEAEMLGASYITAGHIYSTECKPGAEPRGTEFLKQVCGSVSIPVYAIGGIKPEPRRIDELMLCGAAGACIMSAAMTY